MQIISIVFGAFSHYGGNIICVGSYFHRGSENQRIIASSLPVLLCVDLPPLRDYLRHSCKSCRFSPPNAVRHAILHAPFIQNHFTKSTPEHLVSQRAEVIAHLLHKVLFGVFCKLFSCDFSYGLHPLYFRDASAQFFQQLRIRGFCFRFRSWHSLLCHRHPDNRQRLGIPLFLRYNSVQRCGSVTD